MWDNLIKGSFTWWVQVLRKPARASAVLGATNHRTYRSQARRGRRKKQSGGAGVGSCVERPFPQELWHLGGHSEATQSGLCPALSLISGRCPRGSVQWEADGSGNLPGQQAGERRARTYLERPTEDSQADLSLTTQQKRDWPCLSPRAHPCGQMEKDTVIDQTRKWEKGDSPKKCFQTNTEWSLQTHAHNLNKSQKSPLLEWIEKPPGTVLFLYLYFFIHLFVSVHCKYCSIIKAETQWLRVYPVKLSIICEEE